MPTIATSIMAKLTLALLFALAGFAAGNNNAESMTLRRTAEMNHRELSFFGSGWSWSNLLYCSKVVPPHLHKYCRCVRNSSDGGLNCASSDYSSSGSEAEDYSEASEETSAGDNAEFYEYDDKASQRQGSTRTSKLWALFLAAGAVTTAAVVGAVAYRKRQQSDGLKTASKGLMSSNKARSGIVAGGIFAGALASMGLASRAGDTDDEDQSHVSRRMQMMSRGEDYANMESVESMDAAALSRRPSFVRVGASMAGSSASIYEAEQSIEVEGPSSPSSYAI